MPKPIAVTDFHYTLTPEAIALNPCELRDQSRLLFYNKGQISDHIFQDIATVLPENSILVRNNSAVIPCRLFFPYQKSPQAQPKRIECFILSSPQDPNWQNLHLKNSHRNTKLRLNCYLRPFFPELFEQNLNLELTIAEHNINLQARITARTEQSTSVDFSWNTEHSFSEILSHCAYTPLPPYIKREATAMDRTRYQNIYAADLGSVAAPTAGLHFSPRVLQSLTERKITSLDLCLHVNADTFKPMRSQFLHEHQMHGEFFKISLSNLQKILQAQTIISVGTTAMRALESSYYLGCKATKQNADLRILAQSEITNLPQIPVKQALAQLVDYLEKHQLSALEAHTFLFLYPPNKIKVSHGLITNFHQPSSSLLALCASFIGSDWRRIYQHALENNYRFLSYGDSSLLIP